MTKIIRDIWILNEGGTVIFEHAYDTKIDTQLFGGFLSALNSFALQLNNKGLSGFKLGNVSFFCKKVNSVLFIMNTDAKANEKQANQEFENLIKAFFKRYSLESVESWDGDINKFKNFEKSIDESLESPGQKLKDAFW